MSIRRICRRLGRSLREFWVIGRENLENFDRSSFVDENEDLFREEAACIDRALDWNTVQCEDEGLDDVEEEEEEEEAASSSDSDEEPFRY